MSKYFIVIFFLWANYASSQSPNSGQSSMFRVSPAHPGAYDDAHSNSTGSVKWKFKTAGKIFSSPAICNGLVYIGSEDHALYAVEESSGKRRWKFITGGAVHSSPAVYKNVVYAGSYDGFYYALNALTGKLVWKFKTGGEKKVAMKGLWGMKPSDQYQDDPYDFFLSSPVLNLDDKDLTVYFGSSDGNLYAVNAVTGKKKWSFKTNGIVRSSPALYNGKIYFGSWDAFLYAVDAKTGKLQWKFETGKQPVVHLLEGIQSSPSCADGSVYFGDRDGFLYALDAETGKFRWKYDAKSSWVLTAPAIKNGNVYLGTSDTFLFLGLDAKTGKEKIQFKANGYVYSSPAISGNTAFFGDFTGKLYAVDLSSGKLNGKFSMPGNIANAKAVLNPEGNIDFGYITRGKDLALYSTTVYGMDKLYTLGPIVSSPVIDKNVIFCGSADGYLYALNLKQQ